MNVRAFLLNDLISISDINNLNHVDPYDKLDYFNCTNHIHTLKSRTRIIVRDVYS